MHLLPILILGIFLNTFTTDVLGADKSRELEQYALKFRSIISDVSKYNDTYIELFTKKEFPTTDARVKLWNNNLSEFKLLYRKGGNIITACKSFGPVYLAAKQSIEKKDPRYREDHPDAKAIKELFIQQLDVDRDLINIIGDFSKLRNEIINTILKVGEIDKNNISGLELLQSSSSDMAEKDRASWLILKEISAMHAKREELNRTRVTLFKKLNK